MTSIDTYDSGTGPTSQRPSASIMPTIDGAEYEPGDSPDAERPALARMRAQWELPDLLLGGTEAMRAAGEKVLIRENEEGADEYARRVARCVLTNYYGNTIDEHSAKPFAKGIKFDPPLPERLNFLEYDADGSGRGIAVLGRDMLHEGIHRGLTHVLVDKTPGKDRDYSDTIKRRPVMLHVRPDRLLDVRTERRRDGGEAVSYARIKQDVLRPKGRFGYEEASVILEIQASQEAREVTTYERVKGKWAQSETTQYGLDGIPLFTFFAKQVGDGEFEGEPAYLPLAELNRAHYQSDAAQRHSLAYGRFHTLAGTGIREVSNPAEAAASGKKKSQKTTMGPNRKVFRPEPDANLFLLETSGAPLAAGQSDLDALERRMERFGAAQVSREAGITATSRQLDSQRDSCNLEAWCTRLERVLLDAVFAVAKWLGVELPEGQQIVIDRSFAEAGSGKDDVPHIITMARDRQISTGTLLAEMTVRGILKTVKDPEAEVEKIAEEAERSQQMQMDRMAANIIAERGAGESPENAAPVEPEATAEPTFNELTLGVERLVRAGNTEGANTILNEAAKLLGVRSLGKAKPPQPQAGPSGA